MAVFRSGVGLAPPWCEVEFFDVRNLRPGDICSYGRVGSKERLFVVRGDCRITLPGGTTRALEGNSLELSSPAGNFDIVEVIADTALVRVCGRWGEPTGACGVFQLDNSTSPMNTGDPTPYPRTTHFDNHYHDCDEYWIIVEGRAIAISGKNVYTIGPGDCLATGMGHHHDLPQVIEPLRGVYFESTLEGERRPGHLWDHSHGPAQPKRDRV